MNSLEKLTPPIIDEHNNSNLILNLQARINFTRVGWFIAVTFTIFNLLFASVHLPEWNDPEIPRRNLPQISQPAQQKKDCSYVRKNRKAQPKKRKCF